ncbi:2-dehydropantoate 2-reductase [Candidatus Woesearchaeota archaeon]|nr:2-dehydropantoate 2-reductase [Candidatus Woesearchaeota archaeon]
MTIVILGAGGIGSLIGGFLSKQNDVLLVGRRSHIDKINRKGLEITGSVNENFKVNATTKIISINENDLIVLTTKATDNKRSLDEIKHLIRKSNTVLCLQNGLGNEEQIKKIVDCRVVRGIITAGVTFLEPGKVVCSNLGNIFLEDSDASEKIADMLNESGLDAEIRKDIKKLIWKKLILNCVLNPLTAILKVENNGISDVLDVAKMISDEAVEAAKTQHIDFNKYKVFRDVCRVINSAGSNKSSMLQDILKGRKTEIDFLNGRIAEIAEKHKIGAPVNMALTDIIRFLENKKLKTKI